MLENVQSTDRKHHIPFKTNGEFLLSCLEFPDRNRKKNSFLPKRTERCVENKRLVKNEPETNPKRTENEPGQVVENTQWVKKRTENEPENEAGHLIEKKRSQESSRNPTPTGGTTNFHRQAAAGN